MYIIYINGQLKYTDKIKVYINSSVLHLIIIKINDRNCFSVLCIENRFLSIKSFTRQFISTPKLKYKKIKN